MSYFQHPVKLEGKKVRLLPLDTSHFEDLKAIAKSPEIWNYLPIRGTDGPVLQMELKAAMLHRVNREQYPFTIFDKEEDRIIGSTRLYNIYPHHRKLEIGWTWYAPAYWGKGHNTECKYLLFGYCFEVLKTVRVQLQTRETNIASRKAIEKVGGKLEGILRNDRIRADGTSQNTVIFSIIDSEWPELKARLEQQMDW